jgi:hypothetical protein
MIWQFEDLVMDVVVGAQCLRPKNGSSLKKLV